MIFYLYFRDKILCNLGYCYIKKNEPEEALKVFHSVAEATFSYTIGLAYSHFKGLCLNSNDLIANLNLNQIRALFIKINLKS